MLARACLIALVLAPAGEWDCIGPARAQIQATSSVVSPESSPGIQSSVDDVAAISSRPPPRAKQQQMRETITEKRGRTSGMLASATSAAAVSSFLVSLGCRPSGAAGFAAHIAREAPLAGIDWRLASAVLFSESTCRKEAVSASGDVGGWQLRRSDSRYRRYTTAQLHDPRTSTRLAMRRLAHARDMCPAGAPPLVWLGGYAGLACGESRYSRRVVARMEGERRS